MSTVIEDAIRAAVIPLEWRRILVRLEDNNRKLEELERRLRAHFRPERDHE